MSSNYRIMEKTLLQICEVIYASYGYFCSILSYCFYISFLKSFLELTIQNLVYFIHFICGPIEPGLTFFVLTLILSFFLFLVAESLTLFVKTDEQFQNLLNFLTPNLTALVFNTLYYLATFFIKLFLPCLLFLTFLIRKVRKPFSISARSVSFSISISRVYSIGEQANAQAAPIKDLASRALIGPRSISNIPILFFKIRTRRSQAIAVLKVIFSALTLVLIFFLILMVFSSTCLATPLESPGGGSPVQVETPLNDRAETNDEAPPACEYNEQVESSKRKFSEDAANTTDEASLLAKRAKEKKYRLAQKARLDSYSSVDIQLRALVREARKKKGVNPTRLENNASKLYEDMLRNARLAQETGSSHFESRGSAETNRKLIAYAKEKGTPRNTFVDAIRRDHIDKVSEMEVFTSNQVLTHHEKNLDTLSSLEKFKAPTYYSSKRGEANMFKDLRAYVNDHPDKFDLLPDSYFSVLNKNNDLIQHNSLEQPLSGVAMSSSACASGIDNNLVNLFDVTTGPEMDISQSADLDFNEPNLPNNLSELDAATMATQFFDLPQ